MPLGLSHTQSASAAAAAIASAAGSAHLAPPDWAKKAARAGLNSRRRYDRAAAVFPPQTKEYFDACSLLADAHSHRLANLRVPRAAFGGSTYVAPPHLPTIREAENAVLTTFELLTEPLFFDLYPDLRWKVSE
jgi:hypothetical protein